MPRCLAADAVETVAAHLRCPPCFAAAVAALQGLAFVGQRNVDGRASLGSLKEDRKSKAALRLVSSFQSSEARGRDTVIAGWRRKSIQPQRLMSDRLPAGPHVVRPGNLACGFWARGNSCLSKEGNSGTGNPALPSKPFFCYPTHHR